MSGEVILHSNMSTALPGIVPIRCENLTLDYITSRSQTHAVRHVSLEIAPNTFAGIVGPSGSGKTSLLYLLSGLKAPSAGAVFVGDFHYSAASANVKLDFRRRHFGFVFQQPFLVPYLTILENVLVPVESGGAADEKYALELLDELGITELAAKFPNECSGGERVRTSIARGLVARPDFLFVDEPTANLDLATGRRVMEVLTLQREHGTLIVVTHDLEMLAGADIVFRMRDGDLIETFEPSEALSPAEQYSGVR